MFSSESLTFTFNIECNRLWVNSCSRSGVRVKIYFPWRGCPVASAPFVEKTVLPPLTCFCTRSGIGWQWLCGSISGLPIPFHWSLCLSLCWSHRAFITLVYSKNSNRVVISPISSFFFKIGSAPLLFYINFRIIFSIPQKSLAEILIGTALSLYINFGENDFFQSRNMAHLPVFSDLWFLSSVFCSFQHQALNMFC